MGRRRERERERERERDKEHIYLSGIVSQQEVWVISGLALWNTKLLCLAIVGSNQFLHISLVRGLGEETLLIKQSKDAHLLREGRRKQERGRERER